MRLPHLLPQVVLYAQSAMKFHVNRERETQQKRHAQRGEERPKQYAAILRAHKQ